MASSILSGVLAASAGVFGKFAFQDSGDLWYYKVLSGIFMLIVNSFMLKFLIQSFKELGASKATVINLSFNYVSSALLGFYFYSEKVSQTWILGAILMFIGVFIISSEKDEKKDDLLSERIKNKEN